MCVACGQQVKLCTSCDRGNIYCSKECSKRQRQKSVKRAKRRYQQSFHGAVKHAASQKAYCERQKKKVMDQGSVEAGSDVIVLKVKEEDSLKPQLIELSIEESGRARCHMCRRWCGPFARLGPWRRSRRGKQFKFGGKRTSDSESRNGSRDHPAIQR
jgi:hypothetical protein